MSKNYEDLSDEALKNIREDREKTKDLLNDLITYMTAGADRHKDVGFTLAKYLETLQRSNEQLVKILALNKKSSSNFEDQNISDEEKDSIFDQLHNVGSNIKPKKVKNGGR